MTDDSIVGGHNPPLPFGSAPKVSIVIPVYNGANYLRGAIESALTQTYDNIEIIVINDGSDDMGATRDICIEFGDQILYYEQENKGVAGAINRAMEVVSGELFCWLSHDDEFMPEKTTKQVEFLNSFSRKNIIAFSNYFLINEKGQTWHESNFDTSNLRKRPGLALLRGMVNGCTLMIPTEILQKHLPFKQTLKYTQDYEMWNRLRKDASFVLMSETLVKYRIHPEQDTRASNKNCTDENNKLWILMMEDRTETEKIILSGSRQKYYSDLQIFLSKTPFKEAESFARNRSNVGADSVLVTVVIPFFNQSDLTIRALDSVINQTHENLEIILINDGSTESIDDIQQTAKKYDYIRILSTENHGPGHARNVGLKEASGEYIAFLDSDDEFLPEKISIQVKEMLERGALFSHTSYHVSYPGGRERLGLIESGKASGNLYPSILESCPIATPTVMIHRLVISMGLSFPSNLSVMEDVHSWIWLCQRTQILGIEKPLSKVTWRDDSAALDISKTIKGLAFLRQYLMNHHLHALNIDELSNLKDMQTSLEDMFKYTSSNEDWQTAKNIISLDSIKLAFKDNEKIPYNDLSGSFIVEIGHHKRPSPREPYLVNKRSR